MQAVLDQRWLDVPLFGLVKDSHHRTRAVQSDGRELSVQSLRAAFTLVSAIQEEAAGEDGKACLSLIDVLIDGTYVEALNTPDCVLRGSRNQIIHYLNPAMQESYAAYMQQGRILESFVHRNNTIITGIFNKENV